MTPDKLPSPQDVLDFYIANASESADAAKAQHKMWFEKSDAADEKIRQRFGKLHEVMSGGPLARDWAASGAKERLAAIIVLDQFSRNMFRESARAYTQDLLALDLAREGVAKGDDINLSEAERIFFYLPFEHSEDMTDQATAIGLFTVLRDDARDEFKPLMEETLRFAFKHRDVIARYGRFPHRNAVYGRENTPAEDAYLSQPGAGF